MPLLLAEAPALPLHKAGPFVFAAYIVFIALILSYVAIMSVRLTRNQRELLELRRELEARERAGEDDADADADASDAGAPAAGAGAGEKSPALPRA